MKPTHRAPDADDIVKATKPFKSKAKANGSGQAPPPPEDETDYGVHTSQGASNSRQQQQRRKRFVATAWDDIEYAPDKSSWLVHGILPTEGVGVLYGKWKSFKTFVALDLAIAVAHYPSWGGRKISNGPVVYLACEGELGLRKRIAAYKRSRPELEGLPFYLIKARPNLGTRPGEANDLIGAIRDQLGNIVPALIIIDTLARTLAGQPENGEGAANFVDNAEDLSAAFTCLVLAVHHEGAGDTGRMRGFTAIDAASVSTWHVKRVPGANACTKIQEAKDGESDLMLEVRLKVFEFGNQRDGVRENTLIVDTIEPAHPDGGTPKKAPDRPPPSLAAFMTAFDIALHDHGTETRLPNNGPRRRVVGIEKVREAYYAKRSDLDTQEAKKKAFGRSIENVIERELLVTGDIAGARMLWRPS